jgi:hypothetical protein
LALAGVATHLHSAIAIRRVSVVRGYSWQSRAPPSVL